MHETSCEAGFGLNDLKIKGIELSTKAMEVFESDSQDTNVSIQIKLPECEPFTLQVNLDDIQKPSPIVTKVVGAVVEAFLNQIPLVKLVQNKN
ncbi:hypothetical protein [Acinetobacter portensis]|uniref:hypothetical protein n=1 Tax=Acinetobacter portensis TaxID=1839785 RepID=UPI0013D316FC|nr:hypothetical protein [Acinetobacter portensis]